jgi:phosphoglycerate dehydrogenase-like enzyme
MGVTMTEGPLLYLDRELPEAMMTALARRARLSGPEPAAMATAEGIVAGATRWDGARMDLCPVARVLSRSGIGYDSVDVTAATARGIAVCIAPDAPTVSTAEHAVALLLAAAKRLSENQARLRAGPCDHFGLCRSVELDGGTLGLVGYGRIARRVGRAGVALGMTVIAYDPYIAPSVGLEVELVSFDDLLARSDAISVHAPLTEGPDGTRGLFGAEAFARVRPGVLFVNTARGPLVDQDALVAALDAGQVGSAALDVTDPEPLPVDHPLLSRDDVVVTPHIASATGAGRLRLYEHAVDNALGVLAGLPPATCLVVNPEVLGGAR